MIKVVLHPAFIKAKRVIESCENKQQLQIACNFAKQTAIRIKNDVGSIGSDCVIYFRSMEAFNMTNVYLNDMIKEKSKKLNK